MQLMEPVITGDKKKWRREISERHFFANDALT
jgi:hypothetical protein